MQKNRKGRSTEVRAAQEVKDGRKGRSIKVKQMLEGRTGRRTEMNEVHEVLEQLQEYRGEGVHKYMS